MSKVYEVTFRGEAGPTIKAAFPELELRCAAGMTVLHGPLTDQAALHAVIERIQALGLELIDVHRISDNTPGDDA